MLHSLQANLIEDIRFDHRVRYDLVPFEEFLGTPISVEPMYTKTGFPWVPAGSILGAAALLGLVYYMRRRYQEKNKLVVSEKDVRYKRQRLDMDPKSLAILNLLLRSSGEVPSQKVLDLVENPNLNPVHNMKVKNQLIDNLNFRFRTLLDLEKDLIHDARSEEDRRMKVYRIEKSYFLVR